MNGLLLRLLGKTVDVLIVLTLVATAALIVIQVWDFERSILVVALEPFTPYVVIPLAVGLAVALLRRQRRLAAAVGLFLLVLSLSVVGPLVAGAVSAPHADRTPSFSLMTQNIDAPDQPDIATAGAAIRASGADVVFLQEVDRGTLDLLHDSGYVDRYPFHLSNHNLDIAIYSKFPLGAPLLLHRHALQTTITFHGHEVTLVAVHMPAPLFETAATWAGGLDQLHAELGNISGPVIVAGDFNATFAHHAFRRLFDGGLSEASRDLWHGLDRTFPAGHGFLASLGGLIRLDHVLVRGVAPMSIRTLDGAGSDHRGLLVTLSPQ